RSQGGSSINDGAFELMVHRRLLYDDAFGVDEPLNETGVDGRGLVVRGKHYMIPSKIEDAAKAHRKLAQQIFMSPLITFSKYDNDYPRKFKTQASFANPSLPENIHLLTLEQWDYGRVLLRVEHFFESKDDSSPLSKPVKLDLRSIFKPFKITKAIETTLTANQLSSAKRLHWRTVNGHKFREFEHNNSFRINDDLVVTIAPMEIRTFIVSIE
ncbi:lysosomal alpha-mannosidase-like protein, partial [Leptotrombidium deliense]